ncbi:hypothetical protein H9X88_11155 [Aeromonas hydrophila]|uniref:hypothetical protein n=1 Tax=Aeromonas hydrophila TaxID=644 RepID=UPI0019157DF3|nr:hypothetical protein [Aeromonas hydrophila]MBW3813423.1 hypothetical protein [Aeromonas hydrophila]MCF7678654.1 hypothetical protein [Aeromonas hydrophila]MCF7691702.1 hypothetical protein [Aeromonas hydrophila]MCF7772502.1 hypothetical protein [Aeromonas hydrophila]
MSKMQWLVSWNVARSSRRASSGVSLMLVSLLGWLLTMAPAYAEEPQLGAEYRPLVQKVIDAAKARDPQALARQMKYPFKQEYPIPIIKSPSEMVARFDEVFDEALLNSIASSRVGQDWQAMGWRGIMLGSGEVWLDFDGKVIGINHQTAQAAKRKAELVAKQKSDLYPGLREYQRPELMWQTEKFTIRIDELGDGRYRYASWAKGKALSDKPDLVLSNGTVRVEGTGGNHTYQFTSGTYRYECAVTVLGEQGTPPGELVVYQNEVAIMHQPVIKVL